VVLANAGSWIDHGRLLGARNAIEARRPLQLCANLLEGLGPVLFEHQRYDTRYVRRGHAGAIHVDVEVNATLAARVAATLTAIGRFDRNTRRRDIGFNSNAGD
jgi:hypothetical protein